MTDTGSSPTPPRKRPDLVLLTAGIMAVATALWALFDSGHLLPPQWMLAVGAIVLGLVMLVASVRTRRDT